MTEKFVDPQNARSGDYQRDLNEIAASGVCPFCPENFRWHRKPILGRFGNWFITEANEPYPNAQWHFLIIGAKHKEHLRELDADDFINVQLLISLIIGEFQIRGFGLTLRSGETKCSGATIRHLHWHLIVPRVNPATGTANPVSFPIG